MSTYKLTTDAERLHRYIDRLSTPDGCWPWTRSLAHRGYGQIGIGSRSEGTFKMRTAHRFALEVRLGRRLPPEICALHTCDNKACCRTEPQGWYAVNGVLRPCYGHLFEGTYQDNSADRHAKGREPRGMDHWSFLHPESRITGTEHAKMHNNYVNCPRGESNHKAKLSKVSVIAIREKYLHGSSMTSLAKEYHCSIKNISRIVHYKIWRDID